MDYPNYEQLFHLGARKTYYTRQAYTILDLLGDFGGFNEALYLFAGLLTSFYGSQMLQAAIARELKYEDKKRGTMNA